MVSVDAARSWFRYHHLFADLLRLQLRQTEPGQVTSGEAAGWLSAHGYPVEAIRHAQQRGWGFAARLLADHWPGLHLDGQDATVHALLAGFPPAAPAADPELAAVAAADELAGRLDEGGGTVPRAGRARVDPQYRGARRGRVQVQVLLGMVRLLLAHQDGNFAAVPAHARQLLAATPMPRTCQLDPAWATDLRALTLISLGDVEAWTARPDEAHAHLQEARALARRIGRPYLEFQALMHRAQIDLSGRIPGRRSAAGRRSGLAERHGWTDGAPVALAYMTLGSALTWQARLDEAEPWLQRADRSFSAEATPLVAMGIALCPRPA